MVDIGGGSTEFALGSDELESSLSVDMGCVRMTEKFLHARPTAARGAVELPGRWSNSTSTTSPARCPAPATSDRFVGLAGTVTTVAAVELGLVEYSRDAIHHFVLDP